MAPDLGTIKMYIYNKKMNVTRVIRTVPGCIFHRDVGTKGTYAAMIVSAILVALLLALTYSQPLT